MQVGNTTGTTSTSIITSTIEAGSGGAAGFATWNVTSNGANATQQHRLWAPLARRLPRRSCQRRRFGHDHLHAAGDPADWANLKIINALGTTGALTITGGELAGCDGLLADDTTALT